MACQRSQCGQGGGRHCRWVPDKKGSEPSINTHFDWVYSMARWPDRCASSIRGQSIMCLAAGTGAKQSSELRVADSRLLSDG